MLKPLPSFANTQYTCMYYYMGSFQRNGTLCIYDKISDTRNRNVMIALKCMATVIKNSAPYNSMTDIPILSA